MCFISALGHGLAFGGTNSDIMFTRYVCFYGVICSYLLMCINIFIDLGRIKISIEILQ
jgi:hypothetical protein